MGASSKAACSWRLLALCALCADCLSPLADRMKQTQTVTLGVVVTAPVKEYDHFLRQSAVLIIEHGDGAPSYGLNLESPTMMTIGEAAAGVVTGPLGENQLFMGGQHGGRGAMMVHSTPGVAGATRLGDTGLYIGGIKDAMARVDRGDAACDDFKFFFNLCKFPPGQLDGDVADGRWTAYEDVPLAIMLRQNRFADKGDLWAEIRKAARDQAAAR